jgi:glycosyltransferase involved in cell wall biosynthesis
MVSASGGLENGLRATIKMKTLDGRDITITEAPLSDDSFLSAAVAPSTPRSAPVARKRSPARLRRPKALGKFLFLDREKFFVKGVTYGAFAPNSQGHQFPEGPQVEEDFQLMREAGINSILTYTVPDISLLDQAQEHGLRVIVNIPWMGHVCFLEEKDYREKVRRQVRDAVRSLRRHPAVLMHCVAKELPPQIVRWHGARKVEKFLEELYRVAKEEDPDSLVTYTNFPTTEYLELPFVDVFTFNVYLHNRAEFSAYLARLQHLAGERPLVLTEFGMCSFRHTEQGQAETINWQLKEAFNQGLAGAVVFGWTDPFFQDGCLVEEWGFGLVDARRHPKPSYEVARRWFTHPTPFAQERKWPKISVVVAAHNASRTLDECLRSLMKLHYPDYEVIVINDGSTDDTGAIIAKFPVRGITVKNLGVSGARNEGLRAATGEIIAYIDSDAAADPDWLSYLALTYLTQAVVGTGGPNLVPPEDGWIAKCVYRSPGGPCQVMLDDRTAEHIPGCNMSFYKWALEEIGGFDVVYRAAGDDVDICWRLLERGHRIGYSPSAVVWHHRRPSVRAYWRQQVGYGVSEALLERKHPNKFNPWGHTFWAGRIYAPYPFFRVFAHPIIYQGLWGSAGFQCMYDKGGMGVLSFLPRAMEWHFFMGALTLFACFYPWAFVVVGLGLMYTISYGIACGKNVNLDVLLASEPNPSWHRRLLWRSTIAYLHFVEPLARDWGRLKGGLTPWRSVLDGQSPKRPATRWWQRLAPIARSVRWTQPGTMQLDKFPILGAMTRKLHKRGCFVGWNPTTEHWDLKVGRGALAESRVSAVVEHHGGARRTAKISALIRPPRLIRWTLVVMLAAAVLLGWLGKPWLAAALSAGLALLWIASVVEASRLEAVLLSAADEAASELMGVAKAAASIPPASEEEALKKTTVQD